MLSEFLLPVALVSCHLLAREAPARTRSACGMSPRLARLVPACYLFCTSSVGWSRALGYRAAVTTLRGLTSPPQPLLEKKIVLDSIYFQVEKNQRALQGEGEGEVLRISVFPLCITYLLKPVRHN